MPSLLLFNEKDVKQEETEEDEEIPLNQQESTSSSTLPLFSDSITNEVKVEESSDVVMETFFNMYPGDAHIQPSTSGQADMTEAINNVRHAHVEHPCRMCPKKFKWAIQLKSHYMKDHRLVLVRFTDQTTGTARIKFIHSSKLKQIRQSSQDRKESRVEEPQQTISHDLSASNHANLHNNETVVTRVARKRKVDLDGCDGDLVILERDESDLDHEEVKFFINEVRKNPALWKMKHKDYKNTAFKRTLYDQLDRTLQLTNGGSKALWQKLSNHNTRWKKKVKSGRRAESDSDRFPWLAEMAFIEDSSVP